MYHHRLPRQALTREPEGFRRRPGRPRQNWKDVVKKDLRKIGISWDEVEEAAEDRKSWMPNASLTRDEPGTRKLALNLCRQSFKDHRQRIPKNCYKTIFRKINTEEIFYPTYTHYN